VQQLHALRGDLLVRVAVELGEEGRRRQAAEAIVRRALDRIAADEKRPAAT